jgi:hypothetical protein
MHCFEQVLFTHRRPHQGLLSIPIGTVSTAVQVDLTSYGTGTSVVVVQGGVGGGPVPGHRGAKEKVKILKEKEKGKENEEM